MLIRRIYCASRRVILIPLGSIPPAPRKTIRRSRLHSRMGRSPLFASHRKVTPSKEYASASARRRGIACIFFEDFQRLTVDVIERKWRYRSLWRNQGHRDRVCEAFLNVRDRLDYDRAAETEYIWNTGWLFLKTKEAVDTGREMIIGPGRNEPAKLTLLSGA